MKKVLFMLVLAGFSAPAFAEVISVSEDGVASSSTIVELGKERNDREEMKELVNKDEK